jgi:hypothetical protein
MSTTFRCDDKDTLVAFLYGEIDPQLSRAVTTHLRTCVACADEVDGLRAVQRHLAAWQPPETELNFAVVQKPATVLRPTRWSARTVPAWMQAAAAILVLTAGAAIANLQVRYGSEGVTISSGWMHQQAASPVAVTPAAASDESWRPALAALEQDLRRELQTMRVARTESPAPVAGRSSVDEEGLMRRVQSLVNASEERQRQELAVRMVQFGRDVSTDLVRMNQGFRQLQGRTGMVEGNQREVMNLLRRVSTQQVP